MCSEIFEYSEQELVFSNFLVFWLGELILQSRNEFWIDLNAEASYLLDNFTQLGFGIA